MNLPFLFPPDQTGRVSLADNRDREAEELSPRTVFLSQETASLQKEMK